MAGPDGCVIFEVEIDRMITDFDGMVEYLLGRLEQDKEDALD